VLVVEDDPSLRELYRSALRAVGFRVVAVDDGLTALRTVEATAPAAVVLDLDLPRLGGRDVHKELRSHPVTHRIPIVVVSGTDVSDLRPEEFAAVLRKPIGPDRLIEAVQSSVQANQRRMTT
jgi:CheY-like chemotaxis protein